MTVPTAEAAAATCVRFQTNKGRGEQPLFSLAGETPTLLVLFVAGALPGHQFADRGTAGAGGRVLVGLDFLSGSFLPDGADAETDFFLVLVHLDDLELVLLAGFKVKLGAVFVYGLGIVAETLDPVSDFDKCPKAGDAENFAMHDIPDAMLDEEGLPDVGLELLHPEG